MQAGLTSVGVDMKEWAIIMRDTYPTTRALESPEDIERWEGLIARELGGLIVDPDELSLTIIWSKKAIEHNPAAGAPSPTELGVWILKRRKHLEKKRTWSEHSKDLDELAEKIRAMKPDDRYEYICSLDTRTVQEIGPIAENMPGGVGDGKQKFLRKIRTWIESVGGDLSIEDGYEELRGGEVLAADDERYSQKLRRWFRLKNDAFDTEGRRRKYVKYKNRRIRRRIKEVLSANDDTVTG